MDHVASHDRLWLTGDEAFFEIEICNYYFL